MSNFYLRMTTNLLFFNKNPYQNNKNNQNDNNKNKIDNN